MIVIETIEDVLALLQPLLETGSVRIVAGRKSVELPLTAKLAALPEPARELIAAVHRKGGTLHLVPEDGFPPVTLEFRASRRE